MISSEVELKMLEKAEQESRKLDVTEDWPLIRDKVLEYCESHLQTMDKLPAYQGNIGDGKAISEYHISNGPKEIESVLEVLDQEITSPGLNPASGGHLGYIPGGGLPVSALGDYTAAVTNKYAGVFYGSPGAVRCENYLIDWMVDLIGYPKTGFGNLASGGSISNLIAMICARDAHNMVGAAAEKGAIYLTPHAHHCIRKSLNIAGLGCCNIRFIKQDKDHKMDVENLEYHIKDDLNNGLKPFLVIGNAGTTDTGIIDPLDKIADICEEFKLWYHVDGAYGGFFILVDEVKDRFKGIERSDSLVLDPHKGLFMPYGIGAVLVRNKEYLTKSFSYGANYMQDAYAFDEQTSPANVSPELTKHFRGLRMWLPLQVHGLDVFKEALREKLLLTKYFHAEVSKLGFETGSDPELSVTTYRYVPEKGNADEFNKKIVEEILRDGTVFVSSTLLNGNFVIRLAVLSFRTHLSTINELLAQLEKAKDRILKEFPEFSN